MIGFPVKNDEEAASLQSHRNQKTSEETGGANVLLDEFSDEEEVDPCRADDESTCPLEENDARWVE